MILLHQYSDVVGARMAQSFLQSHGIESEIRDEHIVSINWLYSNLVGGVKLFVGQEDLEKAKQLLLEVDRGQHELDPKDVDGIKCPSCSSTRTELMSQPLRGWVLIFASLTGLPFLFLNRESWQCTDCGYDWSVRHPLPWLSILLPFIIVGGFYLWWTA